MYKGHPDQSFFVCVPHDHFAPAQIQAFRPARGEFLTVFEVKGVRNPRFEAARRAQIYNKCTRRGDYALVSA